MDYTVRTAKHEDLERIQGIFAGARRFMAQTGNPNQWGKTHPPRELLVQDIEAGNLYVVEEKQDIHGVFYFWIGPDPTYAAIWEGSWRENTPYGTIHRIASDGSGGILAAAVRFASAQIRHLRMDTHHDNVVMQKALEKQGFCRRGIICLSDGSSRIAYDRLT